MGKFFFGLVLGLALGAAGGWWLASEPSSRFGDLQAENIQRELNRTGMVVREKAKQAGSAIADATADTRITATVKTRLSTEIGLATLSHISVSTSEGLVTLAGTASSHEEIAKAVRIALETEGVRKVISTLQIKGKAG